jgi:hypothetical protein
MNGFESGFYKITETGRHLRTDEKQRSKLSNHFSGEQELLEAIRQAPPGNYEVSLVVGDNDYEDWGTVIYHGNGELTVTRNPVNV